jgi:hypothetical protein
VSRVTAAILRIEAQSRQSSIGGGQMSREKDQDRRASQNRWIERLLDIDLVQLTNAVAALDAQNAAQSPATPELVAPRDLVAEPDNVVVRFHQSPRRLAAAHVQPTPAVQNAAPFPARSVAQRAAPASVAQPVPESDRPVTIHRVPRKDANADRAVLARTLPAVPAAPVASPALAIPAAPVAPPAPLVPAAPIAAPAPAVPAAPIAPPAPLAPAAPIAPPVLAIPAAPAAPPAAAVAPATAARQQAVNMIAALRKVSDEAEKIEPYRTEGKLRSDLTSKIALVAYDLSEKVISLDKGRLPADALIEAYQAVTAATRTAAGRYGKEIEAARQKVAADRKAEFDGLNTAVEKKAWLHAHAGNRHGRQIMDDMVAGLGGAAKSDDDKYFVKEALKARYDVELSGDLTTKALPKLYKVLGMVPASHTTGNDRLEKVTRNSGLLAAYQNQAIGLFDPSRREIVINLPKSCLPFARVNAAGERTWFEAFSVTTLHEVGHSVDDKLGFMRGKAGNADYGGWRSESPQTIAPIVAASMNFHHGFAEFPADWLDSYLITVLKTGAPPEPAAYTSDVVKSRESIQRALDALAAAAVNATFQEIEAKRIELAARGDAAGPMVWTEAREPYRKARLPEIGNLSYSEVSGISLKLVVLVLKEKRPLADAINTLRAVYPPAVPPLPTAARMKAMAAHRAVNWCQSIRKNLWDAGPAGAVAAALGDRVYQQFSESDTGGDWTSYALASRRDGVSDYQFRAAPEWFAELYAFYYSKKLPTSHPAYGWLHNEIDVDDDAAAHAV